MIVKNEAHVIRRCLDSVRPIIDHWIIVDTGSTDGTQDIVRSALADLPGALLERPWVDFAHNRSEALKLARPHGTYTLVIDADDVLLIPPGFTMPTLDAPGYNMAIEDDFTRYPRTQLFRNDLSWHYRGVLHEFAACKEIVWTGALPIAMRRGHDGARRRDPQTYRRDAAVLVKALAREKDPFLVARYTFYLAQSYRDCEEWRKEIKAYLKRTKLGFWTEEVYISFLSAALLMDTLDDPFDEVLATFERAIAVNPRRAEARHAASRFCRRRKRFVEAFRFAEAALPLTAAEDYLFLQPWIYAYGLRHEYAISAFHTGQYRAALSACIDALKSPEMPPDARAACAELAHDALGKMLDPVWGLNGASYTAEFRPTWQL